MPGYVAIPSALVGALLLLPIAYLVIRSAASGGEALELLARPRTAAILARSLALALAVSATSVVLGVSLAWLTTRSQLPMRRSWAVLAALPLVLPSYVAGFVVVVALGPRGMLQQGLEEVFGVQELPSIFGFPGAWLTLTLLSYPYVLLPVQASLRRLDPSLEEASRTLGNGTWTTFRRVTLPVLRPSIAVGALLVGLYTLSDFGAVSLLRYETFTWAIYVQYESAFDRTLAATLSLLLVVVALGLLLAETVSRPSAGYYSVGSGVPPPPRLATLGLWRWPAVAGVALLVTLALAVPIAVLLVWLIRGLAAGQTFDFLWEPLRNSIYVSGLAAAVTAALALPVGVLLVRFPGRAAWLLERASYVGFALPGIAVALALVFFSVTLARPLYQTTVLLVAAYLILFFPTALGPIRSALLQVGPRLEEAARTLGLTPMRVVRRVTWPLIAPGVFAGAAMVFLLTMKELPATLILGPIGFSTLATVTWSAASEAYFAQAALPGLLSLLASSFPLALLVLRIPGRGAARNAGVKG